MLNDVHCHFFSTQFFATLGRGLKGADSAGPARRALVIAGWDDPGTPEQLADRWVAELDRHGVSACGRCAFSRPCTGIPSRTIAFACCSTSPRPGPGTAMFVHCGVLSIGVRKKLGLPSAFDIRFGNPLDLHAIALAYPSVPIIIPHFGAGVFREALMVADLCPNINCDTSSSNGWIRYTPGLTLDAVFAQALNVLGPDRLLFGSDSSFFPRGWVKDVCEQQSAALDRLGVEAATRTRVFSGTFDRLFRANRSSSRKRRLRRVSHHSSR